MGTSTIVKYNLETLAEGFILEGKSYREIAELLSSEAGQKITKSAVTRYFDAKKNRRAQLIEKHEKLQSKIVEAEVETISRRLKSVDHLWAKIQGSEDLHEIAYATKVYNEAIDGIAKELGKFPTPSSGVTVNNINAMKLSDIPTDQLRRFIDDARSRSH